MKRWTIFLVSTFTIAVAVFALAGSGWCSSSSDTGVEIRAVPVESLSPSAALRHAQCQPTHWRDCMLQQ